MYDVASHMFKQPIVVAVVGLGKIGLPLAVQFAQHGCRVIGCDINAEVVNAINAGCSHVREEAELLTEVPRLVAQGLLSATLNVRDAISQASVVVVIVPVAIDAKNEVDFRAIDAATTEIGAGLRAGTLVVYETTLPVGTTVGRFATILERTANLEAGRDFYLAYSPERVSSGRIFRDLRTYPKVVGGINEESTAAAAAFYRLVLSAEIITMASTDEAEFVKLIESVYRDVNIALASEFACYADTHGLDVMAAIEAANSQPTSHIHRPGVGVGGHCIPVYPYFLFTSSGEADFHPSLSGLQTLLLARSARLVNDAMAEYAVSQVEAQIGSLEDLSVLILGVAYRGDVRETAWSSARVLQEALLERKASIFVDDPLFSDNELVALGYKPLPPRFEEEISVIILQANHQAYQTFDFRRFPACQIVLDGRRVLDREMIESLGMCYIAIGDGRHRSERSSYSHYAASSPAPGREERQGVRL
jgi:nucleotide sugar dehydrogenase